MGDDGEVLKHLQARFAAEQQRLADSLAQTRRLAERLQQAGDAIVGESELNRLLRARLSSTLAVARAGTFHWHAPSNRFECDDEVARLFGIASARAMNAQHLFRQIHREDRASIQTGWLRCVEHEVPFELEVRIPHGDGLQWIRVAARSHACATARPRCVVGSCVDASASHRVSETEVIRRIADTIPQLVWIASPDGRVEYANDRWLDYTGHTLRTDDGSALFGVFHEDDLIRVREAWLRATRFGAPLEIEARIVCREGQPRWFLVRAVPMAGPGGVIVRWAGTCTDVTEQKRVETSLAEARDARETAIAALGHELRHPLTSISAALHMVERLAPTVARERAVIERQVSQMSRMVEEMLDVARVANRPVEIERRPVALVHSIDAAADACATVMRERRHSLVTALDPDLVVDGDQARLVQVFGNLLANAAKHTPHDGHITVRAWRADAEICVEVRDDGAGITPELLPRIFDPFVQGEASPDRSGGIGLGLTIVRSIVEQHAGTVTATSEGPGRGSTFTVRLPASSQRPVEAPAPLPRSRSRSRRVLVVDDSPDVTEMLGDLLRLEGHQVAIAHDARSALELALAAVPDVALMDIQMPGIDGRDLAKELRGRLEARCPLLVAVTGRSRRTEADAIFDRVLMKPVDVHVVLALVAGRSRRRRRPSSKPGQRLR